ncbi:Electron transfer flavoprotein large subunit [Candidatus Hodgkinia cicadicola]|uniref:Electron transfer flavoprotein large subunit n=1 Tax=Candidatus Hodgkinia cicadicola TaxID=573658 RepID=A0ABX4MHU8_9HYPH|nr:Electron transfer flavoprotein large subunit [Candidatus Hodgkinia cicadicola]
MHDITVADNDSCYHNVICRAATAVNRYVISGVYDILENNVFVRSIYAGRIKQHVSYNCPKPWVISVKLSSIPDYVVTNKIENKQILINNEDNLISKIEIKKQSGNVLVADRDIESDSKKSIKDSNSIKNNLLIEKEIIKSKLVSDEKKIQNTESIDVEGLEKKESEIKSERKEKIKIDDSKEKTKIENKVELVVSNVEYQIINLSIKQQAKLLSYSRIRVDRKLPELTKAAIVIAGGRSFCTEESFMAWLKPLAIMLGAAIGATKAAVDEKCAPIKFQIGSTGSIIAPKLYIAFGISGSARHMIGVENAKTIVAVNINPKAPIMSMANYAINRDMFSVIIEMIEWLEKNKIKNVDYLIKKIAEQSVVKNVSKSQDNMKVISKSQNNIENQLKSNKKLEEKLKTKDKQKEVLKLEKKDEADRSESSSEDFLELEADRSESSSEDFLELEADRSESSSEDFLELEADR